MSVVYSTKKIFRTGIEACVLTISCTGSDGGAIRGIQLEILDAETGLAAAVQSYNGTPVIVRLPVKFSYRIRVKGSATGYLNPAEQAGILAADTALQLTFERAIRYGFRRSKNNSDPSRRIEYLYDAAGKTPMSVDLTNGSIRWGSWQALCSSIATPVMLNYDGTEAYELDRNDQTKKADGTPSDVANANFAGNAMVRFAGFPWVQRYEDAGYEYVTFCNGRFDESYHAYAHTNAAGQVMPAFYWGMFKGSYANSKMRSIAGLPLMNKQTRNVECARAQANGPGYGAVYKSGWDYIADLLTLLGKSDDCQAVFGTGYSAAEHTVVRVPGSLKNTAAFWGVKNGGSDIKTLFVEGFWGNSWEGVQGFMNVKGRLKTKMTPPYNFDGTGYHDSGITPGGTSGGCITKASVTDLGGFLPKTMGGSSSTYYCDTVDFNNGMIAYAIMGGSWHDRALAGVHACRIRYDTAAQREYICSRLSYVPMEETK